MKQSPISGTMRIEKAPPVTTPVPYNSNHTPGIAPVDPMRTSKTVRSAPTKSGGARLYTNRRAGPVNNEVCASRAFEAVVHVAIASATAASTNQINSQVLG